MSRWFCLFGVCVLFACEKQPTAPITQATSQASSTQAQNSSAPTPTSSPQAVSFVGSCASAEELGELSRYRIKLKTRQNTLGIVRIRSNGRFVSNDQSNVLGEIKSETLLYAQGPVRNPDYGDSKAYVVALRDTEGNVCRGYLSTQVVDFIEKLPEK